MLFADDEVLCIMSAECRKEKQQLQGQGHGPQLEMGGVPAVIQDESLPRGLVHR